MHGHPALIKRTLEEFAERIEKDKSPHSVGFRVTFDERGRPNGVEVQTSSRVTPEG